MAAQMTPLAALVTRFGGRLLAGMLQANGGTTTLSANLAIKFGGVLPTEMLLANGGVDNALGGLGHQGCWRAPCS